MAETTFDDVLGSYRVEANGLAVIGPALIRQAMDDGFGNYRKYLRWKTQPGLAHRINKMVNSSNGELDTWTPCPEVRMAFNLAHFAMCCGLFDGWELLEHQFTKSGIDRKLKAFLKHYEALSSNQLLQVLQNIHIADAARTIHILQLLGLVTWESSRVRQLSLACGPGIRDFDGLHWVPAPRFLNSSGSRKDTTWLLRIQKKANRPKNIVLADNDPQAASWFSKLNRQHSTWLHASNMDAETVLSSLPEFQESRQWGPRNAVIGLRIDHEMVPDIKRFFSKLTPSLDHTADLILTVGAGHTVDEFEGRITLMDEMREYLRARRLHPAHIRLHGPGTVEKQRNSPYFSTNSLTTYQILYCKLHKDRLT